VAAITWEERERGGAAAKARGHTRGRKESKWSARVKENK
jgi:hypothetical protein